MQISSDTNIVTISGNIKTISDFSEIKNFVDTLVSQHKDIIINITDSFSITSSVIGYFNKLILKDKISIEMNIGDEQLMSLIDDLHLTSTFKAKKV